MQPTRIGLPLNANDNTVHNTTLIQTQLEDNSKDEGCFCLHKNVSYDFCYHLPQDGAVKGRRFDCAFTSYLEELGLLSPMKVIDMSLEEMPTPAFITAMSENHYREGLTLVRLL
ncbi:unnamed protein product [Strongylus vulgaris]|uniref:Uncharacterized protein n=1 Tax=Strongylus vulgaris TaxID=40348 RepID=A0A3P7IH83_STRVU|nr:unnamed protein product [Strongylus vulgaris]